MYTTRSLSLYKSVPEAVSIPPEGPNSGCLVLQDEESTPTVFFGLFKSSSVKTLPFPQNKLIRIVHRNTTSNGQTTTTSYKVYLIPVINLPLSSNRYYVIKAEGKHKGEAYASSKEEDMGTCCFCFPSVKDVKPRPLDPNDIYQQFQFSETTTWTGSTKLGVISVAHDGHPPSFLRREGWTVTGHTPKKFTLGEATGLNPSLRARLPDFNFPLSQESSNSLVVGKWYCPFMFIKDGTEKDQLKTSMFYLMLLEQRWECIYSTENSYENSEDSKTVNIDMLIPTESVRIGQNGHEAVQVEKNNGKGVVWFSSIDGNMVREEELGLSRHIVKRMVWEEEKVGWVEGRDKQARVTKQEKCEGTWKRYGCYVLIERFVLRRNDGSLVLTYDFRHAYQLKSKWE